MARTSKARAEKTTTGRRSAQSSAVLIRVRRADGAISGAVAIKRPFSFFWRLARRSCRQRRVVRRWLDYGKAQQFGALYSIPLDPGHYHLRRWSIIRQLIHLAWSNAWAARLTRSVPVVGAAAGVADPRAFRAPAGRAG